MVRFYYPSLKDKQWVDEALACSNQRGCEYRFANLISWCDAYEVLLGKVNGCFTEQVGIAEPRFLFPVGAGDLKETVLALEQECLERGIQLRLCGVTEKSREQLDKLFPGMFTYTSRRGSSDYLYTVEQMANLVGRKLSGKRNHINRFLANNDNWVFEVLTPEKLPQCREMADEWYRLSDENRPEGAESLAQEKEALIRCMDHFEELALEGGLLKVDGKVVAFTIGSKLHPESDTFDVQFEKALLACEGAFPMINREFARYIQKTHPEVLFLNREEDLGVEGLRQAKMSYQPIELIEKMTASAVGPLQ